MWKRVSHFLKALAKSDVIFLPTSHWLGPRHVATPASKGCWEAGSAACPERGGDGSHSLKVFHKIPAAPRDWSIYTRQSKVTVFGKQKVQNLSPSLYPLPVLPAGLGSIPRCCRQKPWSWGTEKLFSENGPVCEVAFSWKTCALSEGLGWVGRMQRAYFNANVLKIGCLKTYICGKC